MITLKDPGEIAAMRPAGRVVADILRQTQAAARVGVRLTDLDEMATQILHAAGASSPFLHYQPRGAPTPFPASICTSVNDAVLHGPPSEYRLRDGDLLSVDCGATLDGWVADAATSFSVGRPHSADQHLIAAAKQALTDAIEQAHAGRRLGDVSAAISRVARRYGYGLNTDFGGHGVGHEMHEAPSVPNDGRAGHGLQLKSGMVIAVEPWFMAGGHDDYIVDDDGWTVRSADGSRTVHVEHTIAITNGESIVLTAP